MNSQEKFKKYTQLNENENTTYQNLWVSEWVNSLSRVRLFATP